MATRTTVSTYVSRLIEDDLIPDSNKTGMIRGLFSDGQIVEHVLDDFVSGVGVKAESMYRYASSSYIHGLPKVTVQRSAMGTNALEDVIQGLIGKPVSLEYNYHSPLNNLHYCWQTLVESYGYNQASNEITSLSQSKDTPVYLIDIQVVVVEASPSELVNGSLNQWGLPPQSGYAPSRPAQTALGNNLRTATPYAVDAKAPSDYFNVTYEWVSGRSTHRDTLVIPMSSLDPNLNYFQVMYSYEVDNPVVIPSLEESINGEPASLTKSVNYGYFTYLDGSGVYPSLDEVYLTNGDTFGSFFPMAHFRQNKQATSIDENSEEFKSSTKLLKYLNIDFKDMVESINENPDIGDVESAFLLLAVPAKSTEPIEQRYLFDFFNAAYNAGGTGSGSLMLTNDSRNYSIVIEDAKFKMALNYNDIKKKYRAGNIGAVGSFNISQTSIDVSNEITEIDSESFTSHTYTQITTLPVINYQKQVSTGVYIEISVINLTATYFIWNGFIDIAEEGEASLLIPLDHSITETYSIPDRETLYSRSLHLVFNSRITTKIKWYQTGLFKMILIVVAIVIAFYDWSGSSSYALLTAGTMTLEAAALLVVQYAFWGIAINLAFKYFVKLVGAKWAMVIAVVALLYFGFSEGGLGGTEGLPWADQMLSAGNGLVKAASANVNEQLEGLYKEQQEFNLFAQEKYKELEEVSSLLNHNNWMAPFIALGEQPQDYYYRTCHIGNPGAVAIDMIHNYAEYALRKPSFSDSLRMGGLMDVA